MHTVWSDHVQGVLTLYLSRKLWFDDRFSKLYRSLFDLDAGKKLRILEVGCGPGALAGALARWYPDAEIHGVDRDSRFIAFARKNEPGIVFTEGDAASLPFPDGSFDATISYTVQEHVEPAAFWGEQRRVLKQGGICLCLSARKGIERVAPCLLPTDAEKAFWDAQPDCNTDITRYGVCRYPMTEAEIPAAMEAYGFSAVTTGYAVADLTPDDPKYPPALAEAMIEAQRQNDLEAIRSAHSEQEGPVLAAVNEKYDRRLRLYRSGVKQWDTQTSLTLVVRGIKRG